MKCLKLPEFQLSKCHQPSAIETYIFIRICANIIKLHNYLRLKPTVLFVLYTKVCKRDAYRLNATNCRNKALIAATATYTTCINIYVHTHICERKSVVSEFSGRTTHLLCNQ